jgi:mRNA-degrading endonuclease RelE of RelBE toxin-antitoxin system
MVFTVNIDKPALKLFKRLSPEIQRFLIEKAQVLSSNPYAGKQLKGKHRLIYSLHCSFHGAQYRIIYQIFQEQEIVVVRLAGPRENIYRKLEEMKIR